MVDAFLEHLGPQDVGRHEVGRELHPPGLEAQHDAERIDELGLGEAGQPDEKAVPSRQDRDQHLLDDLILAEDDGPDGGPRLADAVERRFGRTRRVFVKREYAVVRSGHDRDPRRVAGEAGRAGRRTPVARPVQS